MFDTTRVRCILKLTRIANFQSPLFASTLSDQELVFMVTSSARKKGREITMFIAVGKMAIRDAVPFGTSKYSLCHSCSFAFYFNQTIIDMFIDFLLVYCADFVIIYTPCKLCLCGVGSILFYRCPSITFWFLSRGI